MTTRELEPAGRILRSVEGPAGVLLDDGRALLIGGVRGRRAFADVQVYEPASRRWSAGPPLPAPRDGHAAVRLADGSVLVVGGVADARTETTLRWRPGDAAWQIGPPLSTPRSGHHVIALPGGRLLTVGGARGPSGAQPLELDVDRTWLPPAPSDLLEPGAAAWQPVRAPELEALVGALDGGPAVSLRRHDLSTIAMPLAWWARDGFLPALPDDVAPLAHTASAVTVLTDGRILVTGGDGGGLSADLWSYPAARWSISAMLQVPRYDHCAIRLADGSVLVCGGTFDDRAAGRERGDVRIAELWRP